MPRDAQLPELASNWRFSSSVNRRSDVVRMAWHDVTDDAIRVIQGKTGAKLAVPVHPALAEALSAWSNDHAVILTTAFGNPFAANRFGNFMADKIARAGLPERCVTLIEVSRYTKAAEQKGLAKMAIQRLQQHRSAPQVPNLDQTIQQVGKKSDKSNKINVDLFNWRTRQDKSANSYVIEIAI